jgi:hypothetical protein
MLRCNMTISLDLQLRLDDLLAELQYARRNDELGRLALLIYCEVRCWARQANEPELAKYSGAMFTEQPHVSRDVFFEQVDGLISQLARVSQKYYEPLLAKGIANAVNSPNAHC